MPIILVAEDDHDIARLISFQLQFYGYDVTRASDGAEAVESARRQRPDLILLDWMMPVMDGMQAIRALKSDQALQEIPVVIMTARAQAGDIQTGLREGAAAYLVKPFDLEGLIRTIKEVLP